MKAKALLSLQAAVLVLAAGWIYAPALRGRWLWDDKIEIVNNRLLRSWSGLGKIWLAPAGPDFFPLKSTVQWCEWHLFGTQVAGYHIVNLGLHLVSAFLLWRLLARLRVRLAWLASMLFAVHPLAVESVAWISELKNTLSLPLLLLAMACYLDYEEQMNGVAERASVSGQTQGLAQNARALRCYWLTVFYFLLAMLCKTSVAMFPAVLLLHGWWRRGRITREDVKASLPFFVISLVLGLATVWFQLYRPADGAEVAFGPVGPRLAGAGLAMAFYLGKCLLPVKLLFIYPRWALAPPSPWQFLPWLALGGMAWWLGLARTSSGRNAAFGLAFFLVNLAPVLGLIPMAYLRFSRVADHFAYLPMLGPIALAASALGPVWDRWAGARIDRRALIGLTAAAALGGLACESRAQAGIFRQEEGLWTTTLERNPAAWVADNNLGLVLAAHGRLPEAIALYEKALGLNPGYAEACNNLGVDLAASGQLPEALVPLKKAVAMSPRYAEAHLNLGNALFQTGRPAEAMAQFEEALRLKPEYAKAHGSLGAVLAQSGHVPEALTHYEAAVRTDPDDANLRYNLGIILRALGRTEEAEVQLREAERLKAESSSTPP